MGLKLRNNKNKSRRATLWDEITKLTPVQRFIQMHYKTRYEEHHQPIDTTGETEMIKQNKFW